MKIRRIVFAVLGLTALTVTTACAPQVRADWTPPNWPETGVRVVDALPVPINADTLAALTAQRLRSEAAQVQARMTYLPATISSTAPFNTRIDDVIRAAITEGGAEYRPAVGGTDAGLAARGCLTGSTLAEASALLADPELGPPDATGLAIACDVVAAQGDLFGERLRIVRREAGAVTSDHSVVVYTDVATGEVATGDELWLPEAAAALADDLVAVLRHESGALGPVQARGLDEDLTLLRRALASTVPSAEGSLAFSLPGGFSIPDLLDLGVEATASALVIEVPGALVDTLASPLGRRLAAASDDPFALTEPVAVGGAWTDCTLLPCVALTYDDGPSPLTPRLLDELAAGHAPATFFVLGQYASRNQETVARAFAEGHEVAGHTWSHPEMTLVDDATIRSQMSRTNDLLESITGVPVTSFRPPYGSVDARVRAAAGLPAILWSVDTRDWEKPSDAALLAAAIDDPRPGGIVLFHDTQEQSVRLAPEIIAGLRERGFTLVTVTGLFDGELPASGSLRSAASR